MGDITVKKALDDDKTVYMAYRNFADRTRVEYQNDLESFTAYLEKAGVKQVREVGIPIIERYVAQLEQKGFSSLTRKRKVVTIRSFLLFLYQDGYIDTNIAKKIVLPYTETKTPHILTQTECDRIRDACANSPRDRAIVEFLLQTGIKLSELTRLTIDDIEFEKMNDNVSGYIRVQGSRSKKERLVPLNIRAHFALKNYLGIRKGIASKTLFLNRFDEPLGERGVQKVLRKLFKKAGIERASVHTLRHTFGAQRIAKGANLKAIQMVMGLKDARSISPYCTWARTALN
jgi:site-specific recombinase XerD